MALIFLLLFFLPISINLGVCASQSTQGRIVNHHTFHACLRPAKTAVHVDHHSVRTNVDALQVRSN